MSKKSEKAEPTKQVEIKKNPAMYNIILRNYKQAEPSLQVVIALAKVGSTFLDREKTLHNHLLTF